MAQNIFLWTIRKRGVGQGKDGGVVPGERGSFAAEVGALTRKGRDKLQPNLHHMRPWASSKKPLLEAEPTRGFQDINIFCFLTQNIFWTQRQPTGSSLVMQSHSECAGRGFAHLIAKLRKS